MSEHPTASGPVPAVAGAPRIRVSDADRTATVSRLQAALVEGRLDLAEAEERVTAAFAARYDDDLQLLVVDLPPHVPAAAAAPLWSDVWAAAVWRARSLVLGAEAGGHAPPTLQQRRSAVALAVLAVVWFVMCAFVGAAMVA